MLQFRITSILILTAIACVMFARSSPYRTSNLPDGKLSCPMGFVGSWELDESTECMNVRLINRTFSVQQLNLDTHGLEATIQFDFDGYKREYFEKEFYRKLLTSDWLAATVTFGPGDAIDWEIPYKEFESHPIEGRTDVHEIPFSDCVKLSKPEIESFWAFR